MAASIAKNLFDQLTANDGTHDLADRMTQSARRITGLTESVPKAVETAWLEFKSGHPAEKDFPELWSKTIGAFANAGGGVLIWGIYAARDRGGKIDAAQKVALVENVEEFVSKLKQAAHTNLDPPLEGIEYFAPVVTPGSKRGFVVCHIPEGKNKPYESLGAKDRFYFRFDDETKKASLPILRLLFSPSLYTDAVIRAEFRAIVKLSEKWIESTFTLKNTGFQSIEAPYLAVKAPQSPLRVYDSDGYNFRVIPSFIEATQIFHPEMEFKFIVLAQAKEPRKEEFSVILYQRNQPTKTASFVFDFSRLEFWDEVEVLPNPLMLPFLAM